MPAAVATRTLVSWVEDRTMGGTPSVGFDMNLPRNPNPAGGEYLILTDISAAQRPDQIAAAPVSAMVAIYEDKNMAKKLWSSPQSPFSDHLITGLNLGMNPKSYVYFTHDGGAPSTTTFIVSFSGYWSSTP